MSKGITNEKTMDDRTAGVFVFCKGDSDTSIIGCRSASRIGWPRISNASKMKPGLRHVLAGNYCSLTLNRGELWKSAIRQLIKPEKARQNSKVRTSQPVAKI
jgi:hypothetical protein